MRALGISFSGRKNGNCDRCLYHCLDILSESKITTTAVHIHENPIRPCGNCEYVCFSGCAFPHTVLWSVPFGTVWTNYSRNAAGRM